MTVAGEIDAEMKYGFDGVGTLEMDWYIAFRGDTAMEFRELVDDFVGDGDGNVSQDEQDTFVEQFQEGEATFTEDDFSMDGNKPTEVTEKIKNVDGLVGPVDSPDWLRFDYETMAKFNVTAGDKHTFVIVDTDEGGPDEFEGETGKVVIQLTAPNGYTIDSYTEEEGVSLSEDRKRINGEWDLGAGEEPASGDTTVVFVKSADGGDSPAPAWGFVAVAAALGAAFARRRR